MPRRFFAALRMTRDSRDGDSSLRAKCRGAVSRLGERMAEYVTESTVEEAALGWFAELGYQVRHGAAIAPEGPDAERAGYGDVVLVDRLRVALARINPAVPAAAREEALRKLLHPGHPGLIANNRQVHRWLVEGVDVEVARPDGTTAGIKVWPLAFDDPAANDWL